MKVYKIRGDFDCYDACGIDRAASRKVNMLPASMPDWELSFDLGGMEQGESWWPRVMERYSEKPLGDYISCLVGDVIILERQAIEKLKPVMGKVEVLPLICDFGDYWGVNPLTVLDCIDYDAAKFKLFEPPKPNERPRIMRFIEYAFRPDVVQGYHMFRTVDQRKSCVFVDEVFVNAVEKNRITGFKFDLVWSKE